VNQVEEALARVASVDLFRLRPGLMQKLGWSGALCGTVEDRYRKFLALMLLYPKGPLVPTGFIDEFWHAHILDTRAYHADCDRLFGHYIHHRPQHIDSHESSERLRDGFAITAKLYRMHFQIDPWTEEERPQYDPPLCIVESAAALLNKQEVE
jgi:hypothetical protein